MTASPGSPPNGPLRWGVTLAIGAILPDAIPGSTLEGILNGQLALRADGDFDELFVFDSGDTQPHQGALRGVLTRDLLTGLGMTKGIFYEDFETLAEISRGLGSAMPGIETSQLDESELLQTRGW